MDADKNKNGIKNKIEGNSKDLTGQIKILNSEQRAEIRKKILIERQEAFNILAKF